MHAGEIVDGRFEIERYAASGGSGKVYLALDRASRERVALKVLARQTATDLARFAGEAHALAGIRLPGVVRYVADGVTSAGEPYLVTAWLKGETLAERLRRGALSVTETVALASRAAATLAEVHRRGVVHRDLKPGNLLLVDGAIERVTVLDFGIARVDWLKQLRAPTGEVLGTPGYMAPEQARGRLDVDARADVFSLGCVLYECLTGHPAFRGDGSVAVLTKVILEDPPRLGELRSDVPARLDRLLAQMLAKSPDDRPRDGSTLAAELAEIDAPIHATIDSRMPAPTSALAPEITAATRRVMCLVSAGVDWGALSTAPAQAEASAGEQARAASAIARQHGAKLELLDGRTPLLVLAGAGAASDLVARAARAALALGALLGDSAVAVVTGRAEMGARLPIGGLIDRAAALLARRGEGAPGVRLDDVTAHLLRGRFAAERDGAGFRLRGEREPEAGPQLLGKPTACVGRAGELAALAAAFSRCAAGPAAGAVLVTAEPGMGKSRLWQELVGSLRRERGDDDVAVWVGRGDPMSDGAPFGLLSHALRGAMAIAEDDASDARRSKIEAHVARHEALYARHEALDARRVAALLGELLGAPSSDRGDPLLRAARQSAQLMGEQLRDACVAFLRAECALRPVLIVLEDLHWGDLPTVTVIDAALQDLADMPLLVVALARPEVHARFPGLWSERGAAEIRLPRLPAEACEALVRGMLGEGAGDELVSTLVARADGNAFYLEELIRVAARGQTTGFPETVLAMVQAGLEALDADPRRVLRAASVFGETFRPEGVAALVGAGSVTSALAELERRELVVRHGDRSPSGGVEHRFRHALVREAAYGMLTDRDRRMGHALAGEWLESMGNAAPIALAEHFERGALRARAAGWYLRAAGQALRGNDLAAAIERAERGLSCGGDPETTGALRRVEAEALWCRGEHALAELRAIEAVTSLAEGSSAWFSALRIVMVTATNQDKLDPVERWVVKARDTAPLDGANDARWACLVSATSSLILYGKHALADELIERVEREAPGLAALGPFSRGSLYLTYAARAMARCDYGAAVAHQLGSLRAFEEIQDHHNMCIARVNLGFYAATLGDFALAEQALRAAVAEAKRYALSDMLPGALQNLGLVLFLRGQLDEARAVQEAAITMCQDQGHGRFEGISRVYLARVLLLAGEPSAAETEARLACQILESARPLLAYAVAVHASALLVQGRAEEALAGAREAIAVLESVRAEEGDSVVRLVYAEALEANGRSEEAAAAIVAARDDLLARAANISDPASRARFLADVADNARILAAHARLGAR